MIDFYRGPLQSLEENANMVSKLSHILVFSYN
jgi:hypothetical protein